MVKKDFRQIIDETDDRLFPALSRAYFHVVPPFHREECFILLKLIVQKLREENIEFWADRGTLLGIVRHGGMIVFDDNNNLAVDMDSWEQLVSLKPFFDKLGDVIINKKEKYMKISKLDHALETDSKFNFKVTHGPPTVNIICYRKEGRRIRPSRRIKDFYPIFNQSIIFPLGEAAFYNFGDNEDTIMLPIPAHPQNVLDKEFPGWNKYWTVRPRCGWSYYLQKTDAPYFPLKYYPDIRDELFQKAFNEACVGAQEHTEEQYKVTGPE